ncbi:hypothetical protein [Galbibacter sp. BG1]
MYGAKPVVIGKKEIACNEMMFYQYYPIKLANEHQLTYEDRLNCFDSLIGMICCDFIGDFGLDRYVDSYIYLTAKKLIQPPGYSFNRKGYHSDGFMTNDINYIWYDSEPTVFNVGKFNLTLDEHLSLGEMTRQARPENDITFPVNSILRLNQYNIHRVMESQSLRMRTFVKISFSKDKYDLKGNSVNYGLHYNWEMRDRVIARNPPQKI